MSQRKDGASVRFCTGQDRDGRDVVSDMGGIHSIPEISVSTRLSSVGVVPLLENDLQNALAFVTKILLN